MIEHILTTLGLEKGATIGGFLGALVSLRFLGTLNVWQGATALFSGTIAAAYTTPLVIELATLSAKTTGAISFMIGVFGLVVGAAAVKEVPALIKALIERVKGGGS